jgi:hypothetical protein
MPSCRLTGMTPPLLGMVANIPVEAAPLVTTKGPLVPVEAIPEPAPAAPTSQWPPAALLPLTATTLNATPGRRFRVDRGLGQQPCRRHLSAGRLNGHLHARPLSAAPATLAQLDHGGAPYVLALVRPRA